ncbi:MAG: hypothetical protein WC661_04800 [Opitutaceae bacterium]|jgi:hypothetical protein
MRLLRPLSVAALLVAIQFFAACTQTPPYQEQKVVGHMPAGINETSGLAASRRDPRLFWAHNDSGGQPVLYGIEPNGLRRGDLRLAGVRNIDWEDVASFELDGKAWLLVADTGDNGGKRRNGALYVIAEPDPAQLAPFEELGVPVAWKIPVSYPDGPRDCEAVAVDAKAGLVYLLSKRTHPPVLYTLPLRPSANTPAAIPVAQLRDFPKATSMQNLVPLPSGKFREQPTGMAFSPDGSAAVVVTYGDVCLFPRKPGETWTAALSRKPRVLSPHGLTQAEAVAFAADSRTIYVTSEGAGATIMRYKPAK